MEGRTQLSACKIGMFRVCFPARCNAAPRLNFNGERNMSKTSYARRKAHRALGRQVKEGKADETASAAWKTAEEKRVAKLPKK